MQSSHLKVLLIIQTHEISRASPSTHSPRKKLAEEHCPISCLQPPLGTHDGKSSHGKASLWSTVLYECQIGTVDMF